MAPHGTTVDEDLISGAKKVEVRFFDCVLFTFHLMKSSLNKDSDIL